MKKMLINTFILGMLVFSTNVAFTRQTSVFDGGGPYPPLCGIPGLPSCPPVMAQ
jgi:hypothetical protein